MNDKWALRFIDLAKEISTWSKDPSTKVGAVIVDDSNRIISTGYNGLPKDIQDSDEILNNRELKYECILHAEENALIFSKTNLDGSTIITYPLAPCAKCASKLIQAGIKEVIAPENNDERWKNTLEIGKKLFTQAGVDYKIYKDGNII